MKTTIITFFLIISLQSAVGQSDMFKKEWAKTERTIAIVDSACIYVDDSGLNYYRKTSFRRKFAKAHLRSGNAVQKHRFKVKYQKGNIIVRHKYKMGTSSKIKLLKVNGQTVLITAKYKTKSFGLKVTNTFINLGNNTWQWNYKTNDAKHHSTTEIINNWH